MPSGKAYGEPERIRLSIAVGKGKLKDAFLEHWTIIVGVLVTSAAVVMAYMWLVLNGDVIFDGFNLGGFTSAFVGTIFLQQVGLKFIKVMIVQYMWELAHAKELQR